MQPSVYLDTNIFIAAFETTGALSENAWEILDAVTTGALDGATSELTLAELLPKPLELNEKRLVSVYRGLIKTGGFLSVLPVSRLILMRSAEVRAILPKTRLPDAIHIATALQAGCTTFVSNDLRMRLPKPLSFVQLGSRSLAMIKAGSA